MYGHHESVSRVPVRVNERLYCERMTALLRPGKLDDHDSHQDKRMCSDERGYAAE